jgi:PAS domain S-box-containing protein
MPRSPLVPAVLASVAYYLGAKLGLALTLYPDPISTLWPPNAIVLATLLLTPARFWWVILLAVFPAHVAVEVEAGIPLRMVLSWFVSNCSEALIGAASVRMLTPKPLRLESFAQMSAFVACVGFLAPFLSSFLDALFVTLNGWGQAGYWQVWRTRFFSNVLANLTLVPMILTVAGVEVVRLRRASAWRGVEACLLATLLVTVCYEVFVDLNPAPGTSAALLYVPLPLLLWAAMRFGPAGISTSVVVFALIAIWGATRGQGPFVTSSPSQNALSIQLFLIVMSLPLMTLAAVMEERRAATFIARQSEERLNLALSANQLGTWDWHIATDSAEWSQEAKRIFGLPDSDFPITRETFEGLVHPDDFAAVSRIITKTIEDRTPFDIEYRIIRPDGEVRWVFAKGKLMCDDAGVPLRLIGVHVDITERKRAELEAQNHRRELAHLGRVALVGELSGALAHELNQPLAAILANARAGQRFLAHDPPDLGQVDEILSAIVDDDRRAGDVIRRLRALLKKDEGPREELDVNQIVHEVIGIAHGDLIAREISVTRTLAPALPPVTGDRVQLQQVVLNLVLNACDAMQAASPGSRRLALATASENGDGVRITVTDTGTGVRADHIEEIFEPFVTSKAQGLGLGLAICRSIVSAHEGRLWAENNSERGATFHLVLPASAAALAEPRRTNS